MKQILTILAFATILFAAEVADISLSNPSWVLDAGITLNGTNDTLTIVGDPSRSVKATLLVPTLNSIPQELYLVADVHFSNDLVVGGDVWLTPRIKLYNGANDDASAGAATVTISYLQNNNLS